VIVSVGQDAERTSNCLRALREHTSGENFEVLAVGDAANIKLFERWEGIAAIAASPSLPFGEPQNRAAQKARGQYLIFLSDSITVHEGWCEALLEPLRSMPEAGLVGAEGGVLSREGAINLMDDAESGELREADFCTAACFAISRNLFFQAGGFDGFYLPMEEANLGLKIRQTRHKVLHQPRCPITKAGPVRQIDEERMESNRPRFMRRWAEVLAQFA
jgi:hypothetical protein